MCPNVTQTQPRIFFHLLETPWGAIFNHFNEANWTTAILSEANSLFAGYYIKVIWRCFSHLKRTIGGVQGHFNSCNIFTTLIIKYLVKTSCSHLTWALFLYFYWTRKSNESLQRCLQAKSDLSFAAHFFTKLEFLPLFYSLLSSWHFSLIHNTFYPQNSHKSRAYKTQSFLIHEHIMMWVKCWKK